MVDRTRGVTGICRVASLPVIDSYAPHFGEEPPLTGSRGSGTIFFSSCNLTCAYCQNYEVSQLGSGREISTDELSSIMLLLQKKGCHNINFVTPTHQIAQIVESLPKAIEGGLEIPLVYNSGGYDSPETIKLLEGIFDIYLPDIKYGDDWPAMSLSFAPGYFELSRLAVREMHRQVGELEITPAGIATRGLMVRHLVLPGSIAGTLEIMKFISEELSPNTYVNIMDQYRPCHKAGGNPDFPELSRPITREEFEEAVAFAREAGLKRIAGIEE